MQIDIQTETRFNMGDRIWYLHVDEFTRKYRAKPDYVHKIIIEPLDTLDISTGKWKFKIYYLTSIGKLIPQQDCFATEAGLWGHYKDSPTVQKNR